MSKIESENNSVTFSFVVPVYNVEKYIEQCVTSILAQDYPNFEIVLVDDGSTDSSGVICDRLAHMDERIKVIHQENRGLSEARNTGIKNACGEYILFVDSDDYIASGILRKIYEKICFHDNVDVVFLEAVKVYPDGKEIPMMDGYVKANIDDKSYTEVLEHLSCLPKFPGSACTKAIKRNLLDETLYFETGLLSEDVEWSYRLFGRAKTYVYVDSPYYYYRQHRTGSITNGVSEKNIESMIWTIEKWADKAPSNFYRQIVNSFVAFQYMVLLYNLASVSSNVAKKYFGQALKLKWILKYGKSKKLRVVHVACHLFGVKLTAKLLRGYRRCAVS